MPEEKTSGISLAPERPAVENGGQLLQHVDDIENHHRENIVQSAKEESGERLPQPSDAEAMLKKVFPVGYDKSEAVPNQAQKKNLEGKTSADFQRVNKGLLSVFWNWWDRRIRKRMTAADNSRQFLEIQKKEIEETTGEKI